MKKYLGGEKAAKGVYLNLSTWELVQLHGETLVLPGRDKVHYLKVPAALAIAAGPFAGLAFIILLPFIGIVGGVSLLSYRTGRWARDRIRGAIQPAAVGWSPGKAYLARKGRPSAEKGKDEGTTKHLNKVEDEIAKRRQEGEE